MQARARVINHPSRLIISKTRVVFRREKNLNRHKFKEKRHVVEHRPRYENGDWGVISYNFLIIYNFYNLIIKVYNFTI